MRQIDRAIRPRLTSANNEAGLVSPRTSLKYLRTASAKIRRLQGASYKVRSRESTYRLYISTVMNDIQLATKSIRHHLSLAHRSHYRSSPAEYPRLDSQLERSIGTKLKYQGRDCEQEHGCCCDGLIALDVGEVVQRYDEPE